MKVSESYLYKSNACSNPWHLMNKINEADRSFKVVDKDSGFHSFLKSKMNDDIKCEIALQRGLYRRNSKRQSKSLLGKKMHKHNECRLALELGAKKKTPFRTFSLKKFIENENKDEIKKPVRNIHL